MPAPAAEDPYALLAVPRSADGEAIRRAYKRACLRWHPDKHPPGAPRADAERRFKAVCVAYATLSDDALRARHDAAHPPRAPDPFADPAYRRAFAARFAAQFAAEGTPVDADALFEHLFCDRRRAAFAAPPDPPSPPPSPPRAKPPDRELDLPLTLEELAAGCVKRRRLRLPAHPGLPSPTLAIAVRPGYRAGDRIRFRDAVPASGPTPPQDVVFTLSEKPHPLFTPDGDDLRLTMRVRLVDALAGAVLLVRAIDGTDLKVRVDAVIHPGYVHVVHGQGMPRRDAPESNGDLRIAFELDFPHRVHPDDRPAVRDLFARLDAHAALRIPVRRSSSLFMGRAAAVNILHPRRNSTGAHPVPNRKAQPPPPQPASGSTSTDASEPAAVPQPPTGDPEQPAAGPTATFASTDTDSGKGSTSGDGPPSTRSRINRTRMRFASIFR